MLVNRSDTQLNLIPLYQNRCPLRLPASEDLYVLSISITNEASDILQDIGTLHLLARAVSDICRSAEDRDFEVCV